MSHREPESAGDWKAVAEGNIFINNQLHREKWKAERKNAILMRLFFKIMALLDDR